MTATALRCVECGLTFAVFGSDELTAADAYLAHRASHRRQPVALSTSARRHPSGGAA